MVDVVEVIKKAWTSPRLRDWDPNKSPTCRATVRVPREEATGIALPPGYRGPVDAAVNYTVDFKCEFGTHNGEPWYQVTGRCNGVSVLVAEGPMVERKPH